LLPFLGQYGKQEKGRALRKKLIKHHIEIIFSACIFMQYWVGLYPEEAQKLIRDGVDLMMKTVIKLIRSKWNWQGLPAIQGKGHDAENGGQGENQDKPDGM
jgi:hypothetical protein